MTLIFCSASHFPPHQVLRLQEFSFWFWCSNIVFLYTWQNILFVRIAEHLKGFRWISHFPVFPLNIPCNDGPIGIMIVQFVRVSCMIVRVPYHDRLVRLLCNLILKFSPFSDVGNMPKLQERTNDLRFLSIEIFKWTLCTTRISHTVSYVFLPMNSLFP